jgi:putative flippase GtrA
MGGGRWIAFMTVGLGGFIVQLAAVTLLARAGLADAPATALAVELAILHNFVWHERWTWRATAEVQPASGAAARPARRAALDAQQAAAAVAEGNRPQKKQPATVMARLLRFNGFTAVVSIAGNVAIAHWLVGSLHVPLPVANALAVGALSVINFLVADRRIWGSPCTTR